MRDDASQSRTKTGARVAPLLRIERSHPGSGSSGSDPEMLKSKIQNLKSTIRRCCLDGSMFIRSSALGLTAILPLLGAASVSPRLSGMQLSGLIGVAVAYHGFAYVLNDLIDLPLDRSEPRRAKFPLVRGTIQPRQGWVFTLLQIPLAMALTAWLSGNRLAYIVLGLSFGLMAIYNVWGKQSAFPPLTDFAQGVAWGALVMYGSVVVSGSTASLTGIVFLYIVLLIMLANGVHGSLRDIANDSACGVRSTAILCGAHPQGKTGVIIPQRLTHYAIVLQATLTVLLFLALVRNNFAYRPAARLITLGLITGLTLLAWRALLVAARSSRVRQDMVTAGALHLFLMLLALIGLFALYLAGFVLVVLLSAFLSPLLTLSWGRSVVRRGWWFKGLQLLIGKKRMKDEQPEISK